MAGIRHDASPSPANQPKTRAEDRLDSWKEIAAHLRRGVRTVKRWEKEEGLPVHRHLHRRLGTVYAHKDEVDLWWRARGLQLPPKDPAPAEATDEPRRPGRFVAMVVLVVTAVLAVTYLTWSRTKTTPPRAGRVMLAVLPFDNLSGDPDQEFFSDGLTEDMITELGNLRPARVGVIARTTSMVYKGAKKSIAQVASELRVDYLLEGSVRREGNRVRISAQLIRTSDQSHLWAQKYDRELGGIFDVQSQVVRAISEQIQVELDPGRQIVHPRSVNPAAHEATLRGRYFLERRTEEDLRKAQTFFERAIALDSDYSLAYVGLADAHILSTTYGDVPAKEAIPKARRAVIRALAVENDLPAAHAWLGLILCEYDWDWVHAEQEFQRAIELNPNFSYAHKLYAEYLSYVGRFDGAMTEARLARQLDPLSIVNNALVGLVSYRARRYEEAIAELTKAIEMDSGHPTPYLPLGLSYSMRGMHAEAVAALEKGLALTPQSSEMLAQLAYARQRAGRTDRLRESLNQLRERSRRQHVSPFAFALMHLSLGESQTAVDWLERAYQDREWFLCVLKTEPILDALRGDRRFQDLLRRMNFPP
jgi:TolB-like protein/Tfp pilus assembly protein PilF